VIALTLARRLTRSPRLGQQATAIPFELLVTRRLYALEAWIATAGLAIYLAITEMAPRLRRLRRW